MGWKGWDSLLLSIPFQNNSIQLGRCSQVPDISWGKCLESIYGTFLWRVEREPQIIIGLFKGQETPGTCHRVKVWKQAFQEGRCRQHVLRHPVRRQHMSTSSTQVRSCVVRVVARNSFFDISFLAFVLPMHLSKENLQWSQVRILSMTR